MEAHQKTVDTNSAAVYLNCKSCDLVGLRGAHSGLEKGPGYDTNLPICASEIIFSLSHSTKSVIQHNTFPSGFMLHLASKLDVISSHFTAGMDRA